MYLLVSIESAKRQLLLQTGRYRLVVSVKAVTTRRN
jgi:hypothetical protein